MKTMTTPQRVARIKADFQALITNGTLPADACVIQYTMAVGCRTLDEIAAEAEKANAPADAYLQQFLWEMNGPPLFTPGLPPVETVSAGGDA